MRASFLALPVAAALAAIGCNPSEATPEAYLASHGPGVKAKLAALHAFGMQVKDAAPLTKTAALIDPGVRVHVCPYERVGALNRAGLVTGDAGLCNTRVIEADWLVDWRAARVARRGGDPHNTLWVFTTRFNQVTWYIDTASVIESGRWASIADDEPTRPLRLYDVEMPFSQIEPVRFVIAVRGDGDYEAFLYDLEAKKALGGFRFEAETGAEEHYDLDATGKTSLAYSNDVTAPAARAELNKQLLQRLADVIVHPPY